MAQIVAEVITVKNRYIKLISLLAIIILVACVAVGVAACNKNEQKQSAAVYYLSSKSANWAKYDSADAIPSGVKFEQNSENNALYTLTIDLAQGEEFLINKIGSGTSIGFDSIFSSIDALSEGDDNKIKVSESGKFILKLDTSNGADITYTFLSDKISVLGVKITSSTANMFVGEQHIFEAEVEYSDSTKDANVLWTSSDQSIATINSEGLVNALQQGNVTIIATSALDSAKTASVQLSVTERQPETVKVTGVTLDQEEIILEKDGVATLTAEVVPSNATNKNVIWASDSNDVVTVSQKGELTAIGPGQTTVRVTTGDGGFSDECTVIVRNPVRHIKLDYNSLTLVANGAERALAIDFIPSAATFKTYSYQVVEGEQLVSVEDKGDGILSLKGIAEGNATITIKSLDNEQVTASCDITIVNSQMVIPIFRQKLQMTINDKQDLTAELEGATVDNVSYSLDNTDVALLTYDNNTAHITAKQFGTATLHARIVSTDNKVYDAYCTVLVAEKYYFIYGVGLGTKNWDFQSYIANEDAAYEADVLLDEERQGVYSLTRHLYPMNGFQIIFPNVDNYTDTATKKWNKNIPSDVVDSSVYYDESRSDSQYISNLPSQFKVNTAGIYKITLDLTGTSAKVYIKMVSVDVTDVTLSSTQGSLVMHNGDEATLSINYNPSTATISEDMFKAWLTSDYADFAQYASLALDYNNKNVKVSIIKPILEAFTLVAHVSIGDVEGAIEVYPVPNDMLETPVKEIAFTENHYYFNVNNGKGNWSTQVKANVNDDATNKQVKYENISEYTQYTEQYRATVNEDSGKITAVVLGTVTVKAYSVADPSVYATVPVSFYSDVFYFVGENGDLFNFDPLDQSYTSLTNTDFEDYAFDMVSQTKFHKEIELAAKKRVQTETGGWRDEYGVQIVFLGMDSEWTGALTPSRFMDRSNCFGYGSGYLYGSSGFDSSLLCSTAGTYIADIDLSGVTPSFTINYKDIGLQRIDVDKEQLTLNKDGSADINVNFAPYFATVSADMIEWQSDFNYKDYIDVQFDIETGICSIHVLKVEFAQDLQFTIKCKSGDINSKAITIDLIAEHHLVKDWNDDQHFDRCIDENCGQTFNAQDHNPNSAWTNNDPAGHYYNCTECGKQFNFAQHSFIVGADGWYDFSGDVKCNDCGFAIYELEGGTIVKYNGAFENVRIPATINGVNITSIGVEAFKDNAYLKQIEIPNNIVSIGKSAFNGCTALKEITLLKSVTSIGESLFAGCTSLQTATIGSGVNEIPKSTFEGCIKLSKVDLPDTIKTICESAFANCTALRSLDMPEQLKEIKQNAFSFTSTTIRWRARRQIQYLDGFQNYLGTKVTIPETVTEIKARAFENSNIESIVFGEKVNILGEQIFNNCKNLVTAELNGVYQSIWYIFENCEALETVYFNSLNFWQIGANGVGRTFGNCKSLQKVYFRRPLQELVTCNMLFNDYLEDPVVKGKCYAFTESNPGTEVSYGKWNEYFAGTYCYDDNGNMFYWTEGPADKKTYDVKIDIHTAGSTKDKYGEQQLATATTTISTDDVMQVQVELRIGANAVSTLGQYPQIAFTLTMNGVTTEYDENFTSRVFAIGTGGSGWAQDKYCRMKLNSANPAEAIYIFTFTIAYNGEIMGISVARK